MPSVVLLTWGVLVFRILPGVQYDRGIFVSVAERVLAGDRLYRDVWDNKDPLFYLSVALSRALSPHMEIAAELFWLLAACGAAFSLARQLQCAVPASVLVGFVMAPIILTGIVYYPGYTHLPGAALTLLSLAAALRRRYVTAGLLLAALLFFKLVMVPLAVAAALVVAITRRSWRGAARMFAALLIGVAAVVALLWARGELAPYLDMLVRNVDYSQGSLAESRLGPLVGHFARVLSPGLIGAIVATTLILTLDYAVEKSQIGPRPDQDTRIVRAATIVTLALALVVLGLTGLWDHHGQVVYVPAVLAALYGASRLHTSLRMTSGPAVVSLGLLALLLSGSSYTVYTTAVATAGETLTQRDQTPAEAGGLRALASPSTYARVGQNDDHGHAFGLRDWQLVCPRFHQYPFDRASDLDAVLNCLSTAQAIIISATATASPGNETWNVFIEDVEDLVGTNYTCTPWEGARLCLRKRA